MKDFGKDIAAALKFLRGDGKQAAYLFILPNSATGDLAHVLPVLKNPQMKVLVMGGASDEEHAKTGKMNLEHILVGEFKVPQGQVARAVSLKSRKPKDQKFYDQKDGAASISDVKKLLPTYNFTKVYDLGDASKILRWQFLNEDAETAFSGQTDNVPWKVLGDSPHGPLLREVSDLRTAMYGPGEGVTDHDRGRFDAILKTAQVVSFDKPMVVLWGRRAKKDGGAHYDGNHSNVGWGQVTSSCIKKGYSVVLAGQYKEDPRVKHKEAMQGASFLGEFYADPYMPRIKQLCFFDHVSEKLAKNKVKFLHVGMRSGGLDFYGFAGQPIVYIAFEKLLEDYQTKEMKLKFDERMSRVEGAFKEAGETNYNRVSISQPPKRWTTTNGTVAEVDAARKEQGEIAKGFLEADLNKILGEIDRMLT